MKRIIVSITLIISMVALVLASHAVAEPIQWTIEGGGNGHWYEYVQQSGLTWEAAKALAENSSHNGMQGYLATITSEEEMEWLSFNVPSCKTWLGGYQADNTNEPALGWAWVTGEPWDYTNWRPGEPNDNFGNEDYLVISASPTCPGWNDQNLWGSNAVTGYLIEYGPPPALVGYWNFDEDSEATAYDSSSYGNDGAIEGAIPAVGKCESALYFDADTGEDTDYVVVPNSPSIDTSEFTVSCWVSLADVNRTNVILDKRNDQWDRNFGLYYYYNESPPSGPTGNYLAILIGDGTSVNWYEYAAYHEHTPNQDQFFHLAATHHHSDGHSYLRLYLNGGMLAERELPEITGNVGNGDLYIGTHGYPYHQTMSPTHGIIDEVRIYNYALTQEQIQADMEACVPETYTVPVNIKPESCPNPLNTKSQGVLPVAILGTADIDVATIDAASIRLAGVAPFRSTVEDVATPVTDPQNDCDCNEFGGDGIDDLTLKFNTQEIVDALGEVEDGQEVQLSVTGMLTDGTPFEGKDCIVIRAKGGKGKVEKPDQCYAGVPKTGQTICYDVSGNQLQSCDGTGQDGEFQMGFACPEPRFKDNQDGTVTDTCTGLVWLQDGNCIATKYSAQFNDEGLVTWQQALDFVAGINSGIYSDCGAGYNDWRLPNARELHSLADFGVGWDRDNPFENHTSGRRWSSTTREAHPYQAMDVGAGSGFVWSQGKTGTNRVWPVRGGN